MGRLFRATWYWFKFPNVNADQLGTLAQQSEILLASSGAQIFAQLFELETVHIRLLLVPIHGSNID